jgi:hypothetical protein
MIDLISVQNRLIFYLWKTNRLILHSRIKQNGRTFLANHNKKCKMYYGMLMDWIDLQRSIKAKIRPLLMVNVLLTNSFTVQKKGIIHV